MKTKTQMQMQRNDQAFTLIELLIVVAIIAILAAIALPNFLEAQVRAKVARVEADHRTLATALESYAVDYNRYPPDWRDTGIEDHRVHMARLTTPVAYLTGIFPDPFTQNIAPEKITGNHIDTYWFFRFDGRRDWNMPQFNAAPYGFTWAVESAGPSGNLFHPQRTDEQVTARLILSGTEDPLIYDPSNGTLSYGHLIHSNKGIFDVDQYPIF